MISPFLNIRPSPFPPAIPKSASLASPGPFTTQPITATFISLSVARYVFIISCTLPASPIRSILVLPHVGQDTKLMPPLLRPKFLSMDLAVSTSWMGSSVSDTLIVSPIPSYNMTPMPTADFMLPSDKSPVSVIPTCRG